jgi:hypothetical protein
MERAAAFEAAALLFKLDEFAYNVYYIDRVFYVVCVDQGVGVLLGAGLKW